ncbi:glycosyl hydrolase family 28-related protein [Salimicrobium halophilum]|uniref:Pectate lyase superfamily protein n=1 Tax=Salimicrobium halophilum TaxID=86666 RepID=A0A1G8SBP8_9BACI|nr:glycosyl hydrolase family 28-related protein [Salimicrobium halophilum]SDJ26639.1 Pectate lyase superfamily protein [Salimicrobium halophilum]
MRVGIIIVAFLILNGIFLYSMSKDTTSETGIVVEDYGAEGGDDIDDAGAIQEAIDAGAEHGSGKVLLNGDYLLESGITITEGVELSFGHQSRLRVRGNFPVIEMEKNAWISKASIFIEDRSFSEVVVHLDGEQEFWSWDQTGLEDVKLINTTGSHRGTGISLVADHSGEFISFVTFENLTIVGFETGLEMKAEAPQGEEDNFINGNRFLNLTLEDCVRCIDMQSSISIPNEVSGNQFSNLQIQPSDSTEQAIHVTGSDNRIDGVIWDIEQYQNNESFVTFSGESQRNLLSSNLTEEFIEDNGRSNKWEVPVQD